MKLSQPLLPQLEPFVSLTETPQLQNTKSHLCIFKILLQQNILQWTVMLEISMAKTAFGTHCCCYMIKIKSMLRWKQQAGGEGKQK